MKFQEGASDGTYTSYILPFSGKELPKSYTERFPALLGFPLPEKEQWTTVLSDGAKLLLLPFDADGTEKKTADTFRLLAVKAKNYLGNKPVLLSGELGDHTEPALRGMALSAYQIGFFKEDVRMNTNSNVQEMHVHGASAQVMEEASVRADVQMRIMHLVDLPAADKTPENLGDHAMESARLYGFECEVWDSDKMAHLGLNAVNTVGRGSDNPPVFIVSRYKGKPDSDQIALALVGKGVTFDTGGVSMKGSENLHYMKCDMGGGAAMLGAIELAARLKLSINLVAVVPAAENSVDARSVLPGDVIHSYSGKTIEVINTDAEGRLILADALSWTVKNLKPKHIVDMATLTGSAVRALGPQAACLYTDDDTLRDKLTASGYRTGEKLWPMPLWSDYDFHLHSDIADVSNLSSSPAAGSIAAAKFLQVFTDKHPSWAHVDMAGPSFMDSPFAKMKSATGYGVQLLFDFMRGIA